MTKKELERDIEKHFIWVVETSGGKTYKFKSITQRGVSDRIACLPNGQTWFVELKRAQGELSAMQEIFAADMVALKQQYACLWSKEQINEWMAKCLS